ncbi:MAG: hypothetical protein ACREOU_08890 [Candidatus Eiseniibacteriota bacterium]
MTPPSPATHCVVCGMEAVLAPRVHLREVRPGETPRLVALGLCEVHGSRLRKGELRVIFVVESWLTAEGRVNPANPLDRLRLLPHCLACDAPLEAERIAGSDRPTERLPSGEPIVECSSCPGLNVIEQVGGEAVASSLYQRPPRSHRA